MRSHSTSDHRSSGRSSATHALVRLLLSEADTSAVSLSTATAQMGRTKTAVMRSARGEGSRLRLLRPQAAAAAQDGALTGRKTTAAVRAKLLQHSTAPNRTCSTHAETMSPSSPTPSSSSSPSSHPLRASTARTSIPPASWTSSARPSCLVARLDLVCQENGWASRRDRSPSDRRTAEEEVRSALRLPLYELADPLSAFPGGGGGPGGYGGGRRY